MFLVLRDLHFIEPAGAVVHRPERVEESASDGQFSHHETFGRDTFKLYAEVHRRHEREQEFVVLFHGNLLVSHTVTVAVEHIALRRDVDVLRPLLRGKGHEFAETVRAFEEGLFILRIV